MITLSFKRNNELSKIPTRGSKGAAGYDLYSIEDYTLKPLERKLFKTGISIAIPTGLYGRVAPRSGLAYKDGLDVMAGVIDEDYRGDVGVILINLGSVDKKINIGDKIAQIIFEFYTPVEFVETDDLEKTNRGAGGFGSTDTVKVKKEEFTTPIINESELIRIRSTPPKIVELTEPPTRKYDADKPFNQTGKSTILEKWMENTQKNDIVGYEKLVKERENKI